MNSKVANACEVTKKAVNSLFEQAAYNSLCKKLAQIPVWGGSKIILYEEEIAVHIKCMPCQGSYAVYSLSLVHGNACCTMCCLNMRQHIAT